MLERVFLVIIDNYEADDLGFVEGVYATYEAAVASIYKYCDKEGIGTPIEESIYCYTVTFEDEEIKELLYSFEISVKKVKN